MKPKMSSEVARARLGDSVFASDSTDSEDEYLPPSKSRKESIGVARETKVLDEKDYPTMFGEESRADSYQKLPHIRCHCRTCLFSTVDFVSRLKRILILVHHLSNPRTDNIKKLSFNF